MTKIFCDICGSEIKARYTRINFPSMFGGEVIQNHDDDTACDVCKPCALILYNTIEKFRKERRAVYEK